ncbi:MULTISPECIES: DNA translocase FtsK [Pseudoalteromonas]|jgi:S-DNA-T family DNA segregation ATPase FtsK/SpoIIIE|uniref:DNA translocase FtsK n=1 Tax=Pseudoalteromonas TaxID=53246 RepID=UPI0016021214|nr:MULTISPECIES: DNA translocase FtsK 4TM domain-containing protein [Pseudoalteromonas]MBB1294432.1 DNA translocase FtsK 4TM domain-containing protein [Pseudoalteromonas sp. SR41-4]MBB1302460.1 DNA translocase FtsK 4TM domain-containing protein [Pseudoalteromonas sp. SR44-8]MBB1309875.1 DNA translocase FtsK 4TM domain-containing protein [Pseudoalteromonas sp. SR41-8]MBB1411240.1 DNA translocase FtsK 4TM domain-containing protein [Pseudoalteromonas sp. SG44-17]MBB1419162.1 DNA translocase FtsK |tara:strand:- start:2518 stop:4986 length:2469 start_codon:yes stop_codon:yes gene_type:complete
MRLNGVQRLLETGLIISTFAAIFILCALVSFDPADPSWSQTGYDNVRNITGAAGAWIADILLLTFGWLAYFVPAALQIFGYLLFKQPHRIFQLDYTTLSLRVIGFALFITSATAISSINFDDIYNFSSGGVVGDVIASAMMPAFNFTGTSILLLCFFFAGLTLLTGVSWVQCVDFIGDLIMRGYRFIAHHLKAWLQRERTANTEVVIEQDPVNEQQTRKETPAIRFSEPKVDSDSAVSNQDSHPAFDDLDDILDQEINFSAIDDEPMDTAAALNALDQSHVTEPEKPVTTVVSPARPMPKPKSTYQPPPTAKEKFEQLLEEKPPSTPLPTLDLLDRPDKAKNPISPEELEAVSRLVETKLLDFNVQATVVAVYPGPVVTRFELDLAPGIKVSKITGLAKDLARSLSAVSVRVVEVIPGKTYVGIELPNKHREIVRLSEVIDAPKFEQNPSPLTMVLGKDIAGEPICADLGKMPHLLVAGTTGSGKSVGVNVMILSLLYKSGPDDVRMIMIDPKMLELSVYEGIPHLLCEVVTDMKEAANALRWCVGEMERRYKLMSALGVRNLKGYNQKVLDAKEAGYPILDPLFKDTDGMKEGPDELGKLPSIVVVIDEFADMMMIVGKKVEELIARIAQKARAAGIHLILATQRPSVDVITGLIKANIPTRMAFQVSSKIDSRTILDQQGAENLLGMGDMLYLPPGTSVPIRVHGAFVDDHEVHAVVNDWKARAKPNYIDEILNGDATEDILLPGEASENADEESDPLYDEAVSFVVETGKVSVSSVQRKLRVGYNRAARLVEQMETSGIVSAPGHNGARDVLVPNGGAN